jgi:hypothetical protein
MILQYSYTYDSTLATPTSAWAPVNCAGYDTVALTIEADAGWIGTISFWGGAGVNQTSPGLWSLNDAEDSSLVSQVETVVGSTPSYYGHNFRGSVAGLAEFGVYFANPTTYVNASGIITVHYGFYSSAK